VLKLVFATVRNYGADPCGRVGLRRSLSGIGGFESRLGDGCMSLVSVVCVVRSLLQVDHSSRGFPPSVECLSVISKPRQ
jgi:hypothetical protein